MSELVRVDRLRLVGISKAALVGCDDAETGVRQGRYLMAPEPRGVREAVQQEDRFALAFVEHREFDVIAINPPHDRAGYGVWSLLNTHHVETDR